MGVSGRCTKHSARDRACGVLDEAVREARARGVARLPHVRELAAVAGVAPSTVSVAAQELVDAGIIESRRGLGLLLIDTDSGKQVSGEEIAHTVETLSRENLVNRIRSDLTNGIYRPGTELPAIGALSDRYGRSYRPLKRALETLAAHGELEQYKRGYRVPSLSVLSSNNRVLMIGRGRHSGDLWLADTWLRSLVHCVQKQCADAGAQIETASLPDGTNPVRQLETTIADGRKSGMPLGAVFLSGGMAPETDLGALTRIVASTARPVAVLDWTGWTTTCLPDLPGNAAVVRLDTGAAAGRAVGRFLAGCGHREVAFFSANYQAPWSQKRLSGLRDVLESAGAGGRVELCTHDVDSRALRIGLRARVDKEMQRLGALMGEEVHEDCRDVRRLKDTTIRRLGNHAAATILAATQSQLLVPSMQETLSRGEATAWIGDSDQTAIACLDFLFGRKVAVPRAVSVVGFDDSEAAFNSSLTSYSFNPEACAHALLSCVMDPRHTRSPRSRPRLIRMEGRIVGRGTTHGV